MVRQKLSNQSAPSCPLSPTLALHQCSLISVCLSTRSCSPAHAYCNEGTASPSECSNGSYSERQGLTSFQECSTCEAGHYCSAGQRFVCPRGFFNPLTASSNVQDCRRCPEKALTLSNASTSRKDCICSPEYFMNSSGLCQPCVVGTDCSSPGSELQTLVLLPGYWRLAAQSLDVRRCPDAWAVIDCEAPRNASAASVQCEESLSGCRGGSDADAQCGPMRTRPVIESVILAR